MKECKKAGFPSDKEAQLRIKEIAKLNRKKHYRKRMPVRSYLCEFCGQHHLTSKTEQEWNVAIGPKDSEDRINEWMKGKLVFKKEV